MNRAARPERAGIRQDALAIQDRRDDSLGHAFLQEEPVDAEHHGDLFSRTGNQHHTVGLDAFFLTARQQPFDVVLLVDQLAPQAKAGRAALAVAVLNDVAGTGEDLDRQLPAVLRRHTALDANEHRRRQRAVVVERLGAIDHADAAALARMLVDRRLVRVGETPPSAHVVHQHGAETRVGLFDVAQQRLQTAPALEIQAALAGVRVGSDDPHAVVGCVL